MYNGDNAHADFIGGTLSERYLFAPAVDALLGRMDGGNDFDWYLTDHLGSVRQIVNADATVADTLTYDAYGKKIESNEAEGGRFKFTGREWDKTAELYHYRARPYDPGSGRFTGEDPIGMSSGDPNLFRYVHNNPNYMTDPYGLEYGILPPLPPGQTDYAVIPGNWVRFAEAVGPGQWFDLVRGGLGSSYFPPHDTGRPVEYRPTPTATSYLSDSWEYGKGFCVEGFKLTGKALASLIVIPAGFADWTGVPGMSWSRDWYNEYGEGFNSLITDPTGTLVTRPWHGFWTALDQNRYYDAGGIHGSASASFVLIASGFANGQPTTLGRALGLRGPNDLVRVTSWADAGITADLNPGRWVITGGPTRLNFWRTGLPAGRYAVSRQFPWLRRASPAPPFENYISGCLLKSQLRWPSLRDGLIECGKGCLGQRIIRE